MFFRAKTNKHSGKILQYSKMCVRVIVPTRSQTHNNMPSELFYTDLQAYRECLHTDVDHGSFSVCVRSLLNVLRSVAH